MPMFFRSPHFACPHFETPDIETPHFVSPHFACRHFGTRRFACPQSAVRSPQSALRVFMTATYDLGIFSRSDERASHLMGINIWPHRGYMYFK